MIKYLSKIFCISLLIGKKPTSSIIKTLYDVKCLSLLAKQFSIYAFFNCAIKSLAVIKYVWNRFLADSMPTAVAR